MKKSLEMDMTTGPFLPKLIRFSVPILLMNTLQLLFNAADLVVVGQFSDVSGAVGAVGATTALVNLVVNLFIGFGVGVNVVVGHAIGAGKKDEVPTVIGTAAVLGLLSGVIVTAIGSFGSEYFLAWMNTPADLLPLSAKYLKIYFLGAPAILLYNFLSAVLRAYGDTKRPLLFLAVSGLANIGFNILFVAYFGMDVDGVAYATVLSNYLSLVMITVTLLRSKDYCRLSFRECKLNGYYLKKILGIGLPSGLYHALFSISNTIVQIAANSFGSTVILNGLSAAGSLDSFVYNAMDSAAVSAVSFVSQNAGAKKFLNIKKIIRLTALLIGAAWILFGGTLILFREPLFALYLPDNPEAIRYGIVRMLWTVIPYYTCGLMSLGSNALRGLNRATLTTVVSLIGSCGVRLAWIFAVFYPTKGMLTVDQSLGILYGCYAVSWLFTTAALYICYRLVLKENIRHYGEMPAAIKE